MRSVVVAVRKGAEIKGDKVNLGTFNLPLSTLSTKEVTPCDDELAEQHVHDGVAGQRGRIHDDQLPADSQRYDDGASRRRVFVRSCKLLIS